MAGSHLDNYAGRGQVLVVAAVALMVLGLIAALAVDVGRAYAARARLQNAADAAALAAAQKLLEARLDGSTDEATARQAALLEACSIAARNWAEARAEVAFGSYENDQFWPQSTATPAMAVQVRAFRDGASPGGEVRLFFAPLAGHNTVSVSASAVSEIVVGVKTIRSDLRPFTIPASVLEGVSPGDICTFILPHGPWQELWEDDQFSPGGFGLVNLDGGALSTAELLDYVYNGYPGEITIDPDVGYVWLDGNCGVRASLEDALASLIGREVFVCVHDQSAGEGANAQFHVINFACVTILEVQFTGSDKHITVRFNNFAYVPNCEGGGPEGTNLCKIQLVS